MKKFIQFGEMVPHYNIRVLNEREIRAAAGMMFLATFISLMFIMFQKNFVPIKYVVTIFLMDFVIRLFVNPKFAPVLILGRVMVRNQRPEYVGAAQKKFAWYIGLILSGAMFLLMVILNTYSIITGLVCLICLILMFFETAFGICIGCKLYQLIQGRKAQYCSGEICQPNQREEIQKTSLAQWIMVLILAVLMALMKLLLNDTFREPPTNLFELFY